MDLSPSPWTLQFSCWFPHVQQIGYNVLSQGTSYSNYPLPPTVMPIGIRPINDFAFKKTFGTAENRLALISLLNATLGEADLAGGDVLACWLYWLLHAHEYEPAALLELLPQQAIRQATETLARISQISEDKAMYDSREKAIRDRNWELNASFREGEIKGKIEGKIEGEIKGKIEMIRTLRALLGVPETNEQDLRVMNLEQLEAMTSDLQVKLRSR